MVTVLVRGQTLIGSRPESAGYCPRRKAQRAEDDHSEAVRSFETRHLGGERAGLRRCLGYAFILAPTCPPVLEFPATRVSWFDAKTYVSGCQRVRAAATGFWARPSGSMWHAGKATDFGFEPRQPVGARRHFRCSSPRRARTETAWRDETERMGVHPLLANLLEWVEDCWHTNYAHRRRMARPGFLVAAGIAPIAWSVALRPRAGSSAAGGWRGRALSSRMRARQPLNSASPGISTCCPGPRSRIGRQWRKGRGGDSPSGRKASAPLDIKPASRPLIVLVRRQRAVNVVRAAVGRPTQGGFQRLVSKEAVRAQSNAF